MMMQLASEMMRPGVACGESRNHHGWLCEDESFGKCGPYLDSFLRAA